jgi:hypothetical protein
MGREGAHSRGSQDVAWSPSYFVKYRVTQGETLGHSTGHSKHKYIYVYVSYLERFLLWFFWYSLTRSDNNEIFKMVSTWMF